MKFLTACVLGFCFSACAHAETLVLMSGQKIEGQIIKRTDMHIVVDVKDTPQTFYLAEIATIDGKPIEAPQMKPKVPQEQKKVKVPYFNDEQDSLARFMDVRAGVKPSRPAASQAPVKAANSAAPATKLPQPPSAVENNKNVVPTPDGGIIVVTGTKITKYDKDLRVVKEININS